MLLNDLQINSILEFWFPNENYNKFWFDKSCDIIIYEQYYNLLNETFKNINTIDKLEDL